MSEEQRAMIRERVLAGVRGESIREQRERGDLSSCVSDDELIAETMSVDAPMWDFE